MHAPFNYARVRSNASVYLFTRRTSIMIHAYNDVHKTRIEETSKTHNQPRGLDLLRSQSSDWHSLAATASQPGVARHAAS